MDIVAATVGCTQNHLEVLVSHTGASSDSNSPQVIVLQKVAV